MKDDIEEVLDFLENNEVAAFKDLYAAYGNKIRYVLASRILIQASKLYSTIKFPRLIKAPVDYFKFYFECLKFFEESAIFGISSVISRETMF